LLLEIIFVKFFLLLKLGCGRSAFKFKFEFLDGAFFVLTLDHGGLLLATVFFFSLDLSERLIKDILGHRIGLHMSLKSFWLGNHFWLRLGQIEWLLDSHFLWCDFALVSVSTERLLLGCQKALGISFSVGTLA
jgi:hypothetical protein